MIGITNKKLKGEKLMANNQSLSRQWKYRKRRRKRQWRIAAVVLSVIGLGLGIQHALGNPLGQWMETVISTESSSSFSDEIDNKIDEPNDTQVGEEGSEGEAEYEKHPSHATSPERGLSEADQENANEDNISDTDTITLAFVGDVLLGSTVENLLIEHGYEYPYQYMKAVLQQADFTLANLETPVTDRGEPLDKQYAYRSHPDVLPAFKEAGFDIVNLANNHILDYQVDGLMSTLRHLQNEDIYYVGAGENIDEAFQPVVVEKDGVKVAVLGFSRVVPDGSWKAAENRPGVASTYNYTKPIEAIENAAKTADIVVVLAHWGDEREDFPNEYQKELARRYIDAGADVIVGSHPHVLQGIEFYNGKWIAYSLGNFIYTTRDDGQEDTYKTWESGVLEAECDKNGDCQLQIIPVYNKWALPKPMEEDDAAALIQRLNEISFGVEINSDGKIAPLQKESEEVVESEK